jgi:NAD(P)-dependent dehydrogenase (short-subunit alcohol dehydrogenase family)
LLSAERASSAAGILGAERMSNYGAAKTGLIGLTRILAAEGADSNIKVNAIAPIATTWMLDYSMSDVAELDDPVAAAEAAEPGTFRVSSSGGQRAITTRRCPWKTCEPISMRSATRRITRSPRGLRMRWPNCSKPSWLLEQRARGVNVVVT